MLAKMKVSGSTCALGVGVGALPAKKAKTSREATCLRRNKTKGPSGPFFFVHPDQDQVQRKVYLLLFYVRGVFLHESMRVAVRGLEFDVAASLRDECHG